MPQGLEGIKVVEVTSAVAAPMTGRLLGDWGADVIHIDHTARGGLMHRAPSKQDYRRIGAEIDYLEQNINCNKKGIALDLSFEEGRNILYKLIQEADVFISNFRPRELEKFQLQYETLKKLNPRLIAGTLTGFGRKGPDQNEPGFGPTAGDSRSGLLHVLLTPDGEPAQTPIAYADFITGLTLAYGLMTALLIRERTGVAQEVDASLFNSLVFALTSDVAGALVTGQDRQAMKRCDRQTPFLNTYRTKDNRWLYIMMSRQDVFWPRFCKALDRPDLEHDPRYNLQQLDNDALFRELENIFLTKTLEEWKPRLTEAGFPWAPLQSLPEVVKDEQARANGFFRPLNHPEWGPIEVIANPAKLSHTVERQKTAAPKFGTDTERVLLEIGYSAEQIISLREKGVIN